MPKLCGNELCQSGKEASKLCSRCKDIYYCCAACQKQDWKIHRKNCFDFGTQGSTKDKSLYDGKSREELIQLFGLYIGKSDSASDLKDRLEYLKNAVDLEDNHLKRMDSDPKIRVTMMILLRRLGEGHRFRIPLTAAIEFFKRALGLSQYDFPAEIERMVLLQQFECHEALGNIYLDIGETALAAPHCTEALRLGSIAYTGSNLAGNEAEYARGLTTYAYLKCKQNDIAQGIAVYEKAYECLKGALEEDDEDVQNLVQDLLEAYIDGRRFDKALVLLSDSLERLFSQGKSNGIAYATTMHLFGQNLLNTRHFSESEEAELNAIEIFSRHDASVSEPHYSSAMYNLALARMYQHKLDEETETRYTRAIELASAFDSTSVVVAAMLADMGSFYYRKKDLRQALEKYEAALEIVSTRSPTSSDAVSYTRIIARLREGRELPVDADGNPAVIDHLP